MTRYDKLLDKLLDLDELHLEGRPGGYKLGWHSPEDARATLYFVPHSAESHAHLRRELAATGVRHRVIIEPLHPGERHSNIQILDIDI